MKITDLLLKSNKSLKVEFKLEQLINKYRVLSQSGNYDNSIFLACKIINFIINNISFEEVFNDDIELLRKENFNNYINWIKNLTNEQKLKMYYDILKKIEINENAEYKYLINSFLAIRCYYENDFQNFLEHSVSAFEKACSLPIFIQIVLLDLLKKGDKINLQLYQNYVTKILKIKILN